MNNKRRITFFLLIAVLSFLGIFSNATETTAADFSGGSSSWVELIWNGLVTDPPKMGGQIGAYDSTRNEMIVWQGDKNFFWILQNADGNGGTQTWVKKTPSADATNGKPTNRKGFAMVYDPVGDKMIIFGGWTGSGSPFKDTWVIQDIHGTPTWEKRANANITWQCEPTGCSSSEIPTRGIRGVWTGNLMIVFGGLRDDSRNSRTTFTYNYNSDTWTRINPPIADPLPKGRQNPGLTWDGTNLIMFGGARAGGSNGAWNVRNDVWILKNALTSPIWQQLVDSGNPVGNNDVNPDNPCLPPTSPGGSFRVCLFSDGTSDVSTSSNLVDFSGDDSWDTYDPCSPDSSCPEIYLNDPASDDYYSYIPPDRPSTRWTPTVFVDNNRLLVYGGNVNDSSVWVYDLTKTGLGGWSQLFPSGNIPIARRAHAAVYDGNDDIIVFGGTGKGGKMNDVQKLSFLSLSRPAAPTNVSAVSWCLANSLANNTISWTDNSTNEDKFKIYRDAVLWNPSYLSVSKATTGTVYSWTDTSATGGVAYTYSVSASNTGGESSATPASSSVTTLSCPPTASFPSLAPSPAYTSSTLTASFTAANAVSGTPVKEYRFLRGATVLRTWGASSAYTCTSVNCLIGSTITFEGRATDGITYSNVVNASQIIVNRSPSAFAGLAHTLISAGSSHTHTGASASDADGNLSSYVWSFISCPGACPALSNASGSISGSSAVVSGPTFTPGTIGDYIIRLTVTDSSGSNNVSDVTEKSVPLPPPSNVSGVACSANSVGPTITWQDNSNGEDFFDIYRDTNAAFVPPAQGILVTSAATADKAGAGVTQSYTETPRPAFNTYYYKVIARNGAGNSSPSGASNAVAINSDCEPTASNPSLTPSPAFNDSVLTASFTAANRVSGVPVKEYRFLRGATVLRTWGASSAYTCTSVNCPIGSTITFEGRATDGITYSNVVNASQTIINRSPSAFAGSAHTLSAGSSHTHTGASASDADGNLSSYVWSFISCPGACPALSDASGSISGSSVVISGPTFTNNTGGYYTIRLTVTDSNGSNNVSDVTEFAPFILVSLTAIPSSSVSPPLTSTLTARILNDNGSGNAYTYTFDCDGAGPRTPEPNIVTSATSFLQPCTYTKAGRYAASVHVSKPDFFPGDAFVSPPINVKPELPKDYKEKLPH